MKRILAILLTLVSFQCFAAIIYDGRFESGVIYPLGTGDSIQLKTTSSGTSGATENVSLSVNGDLLST
jgi:hypothetical protein